MNAHDDTIAALSTPVGESGIAVIRISGRNAFPIVASIFFLKDGTKNVTDFEHRRLYHGTLREGEEVLDEVVCAIMRGPDSYTGEDIAEISCHGNTLLVKQILGVLFSHGARSAEAGEFTKRAFLNGKLDLIQAEAVADLIHAKSQLQRQVAQEQLAGGLSARIATLADELLGLLGIVEANIDFIEEGIDTLDIEQSVTQVDGHKRQLDDLLAGAALSKPFREGYRVTFAGPVNAGKSSLFNALLGERRAIVTDIPGTTRDVIREPMVVDGALFMMQDTAGLRGTDDHVEIIGIDLAQTTARGSDVVVFVVDASVPAPDSALAMIADLDPHRAVVALNKSDLDGRLDSTEITKRNANLRIVDTSAETGEGLETLRQTLIECVGRDRLNWIARERVVLNARLITTLQKARDHLDVLSDNLRRHAPLEILALDAREVLGHYETATGKRYTENLLDTIFARFCIGK